MNPNPKQPINPNPKQPIARGALGMGGGAAIGFLFGGPVGAGVGAGVGALLGWWDGRKAAAKAAAAAAAAPAMTGEPPTTKYLTANVGALLARPASYYRYVPKPVIDCFATWASRTRTGSKRFGLWQAYVANGTVVIYGPPFAKAAMGSEFDSLTRHGLRSRPYR